MDSGAETLRWIREADDAEERNRRINDVVRNGPDAARRALFDPNLPPRAAGFVNAEMREKKRREALRAADPEAFETAESVRKAVANLLTDLDRFHEAQQTIRARALKEFDRWADSS